METKIIHITKENIEATAKEAADVWAQGGLVAFPTETVYGLGGNGLNKEASKKIYAAKGRPSDNPLILHIADMEQFYPLIKTDNAKIIARAEALADVFWPGPLTMILPKADNIPYETTGGLDTVAIRMPSHLVARALLQECKMPIAAPSANLSGRPSPTSASHVIEDMNGRIEMIIDGGDVGIGVESTIIDLTGEVPMLLRPGFVTPEMLQQVLGTVETDAAVYRQVGKDVHPKAPGMKYRHYAPKAEVKIIEGDDDAAVEREIEEQLRLCKYARQKAVALNYGRDSKAAAKDFFARLRELDREDVDVILVRALPEEELGFSVMNRMLKSAGYDVIHV